MSVTVVIKRGDTSPGVVATLARADGSPPDLAGATVRFVMRSAARLIVDAVAEILDAQLARVLYPWQPGDTAAAGSYRAEFEVVYADGTKETFPNSGYILVSLEGDLNGGD